MKRSGFRKPTLIEARAKQAAKRSKIVSKAVKPKKATKTARAKKMGLKRLLCAQYGLPLLPCSRWGTTKGATRTDLLRGMLWYVFSKYIRERDREKRCISCGRHHEAKQAGHYVPVGDSSVAMWFREDNVHGECPDCNAFQSFHLVPMRKNLVSLYGEDHVSQMDSYAGRKDSVKWEEIVYVDLINKYSKLVGDKLESL